MDDFDLFATQSIDDDQFLSRDIASVLPCESYSSYNTCASKTLSNSSTAQTSLNNSWNSTISDHSSSSQLLSFENSISNSSHYPNDNYFQYFSAQSPMGSSQNQNFEAKPTQETNRPPIPLVRDHIMAERKRREKLSQSFIALSALVPGLKKVHYIQYTIPYF